MTEDNMNSIFEQINHLKKPVVEIKEVAPKKDELREVLNSVSEEIKRVLDENNLRKRICAVLPICNSQISVRYRMAK